MPLSPWLRSIWWWALFHDRAGFLRGVGETMQGFAFDVDPESDKDAAKIPADLTPAPGSADVSSGKPWTRGPEPPAAALAAGGFALIALLSWRRRLSSATHRTRRRVYTIREMA